MLCLHEAAASGVAQSGNAAFIFMEVRHEQFASFDAG
jgi:hypothetical protein